VTSDVANRPRLRAEIFIVLGLSLGQSAVVAIWTLAKRYLEEKPIGAQTANLNPSQSTVPVMDLIRQVLDIGFRFVIPVALVIYLLNDTTGRARQRLGFVWRRDGAPSAWHDFGVGAALAGVIGVGGIAMYVGGRVLGQNVGLNLNGLGDAWWVGSILILRALGNALLEEVIVVGYLLTRLQQLKWGVPAAIAASAILRGAYHLYQGWPMGVGNAIMGIVFAWYYARTGRVGPLIAAHALLDIGAFVGPELAPQSWLDALRLA
jgi:membrane protease YdiL (CAAX protease family)